jgi:hypothetical protein
MLSMMTASIEKDGNLFQFVARLWIIVRFDLNNIIGPGMIRLIQPHNRLVFMSMVIVLK